MCSVLPAPARYSVTRLPGTDNHLSRSKHRVKERIRYEDNVPSAFIAVEEGIYSAGKV
jgi:hypothetical protein